VSIRSGSYCNVNLSSLLSRFWLLLLLVAPVEGCAGSVTEEIQETVTIDGEIYPVPEAWLGQKLDTPPLQPPALVRIPSELTENQTDIYILSEANAALVRMAAQAQGDGIVLLVDSGYRSAWYQKKIFIRLMKKGRTFDDIVRYVAPPGYSEHMTGTAVDLSPGDWHFAATPAYGWLREHAGEFGFFETLPKNNPQHPWEAWHWRYKLVGSADEIIMPLTVKKRP
jgi:D-alanyl-D-alanine carboxypeptidase